MRAKRQGRGLTSGAGRGQKSGSISRQQAILMDYGKMQQIFFNPRPRSLVAAQVGEQKPRAKIL